MPQPLNWVGLFARCVNNNNNIHTRTPIVRERKHLRCLFFVRLSNNDKQLFSSFEVIVIQRAFKLQGIALETSKSQSPAWQPTAMHWNRRQCGAVTAHVSDTTTSKTCPLKRKWWPPAPRGAEHSRQLTKWGRGESAEVASPQTL